MTNPEEALEWYERRNEASASITDELRKYASGCAGGMGGDALRHIADRIDAEHEKAIKRAVAEGNLETAAEFQAEIDAEYIKLPVDADGVPIHVGDLMEDGKKVARIVLTDDEWEPYVYIYEQSNVLSEYYCNEVSHYHPPTVEDVLREYEAIILDPDNANDGEYYRKMYAAKLRLAESEEE